MAKAKSFHRWGGLLLAPFMILFAITGIVLNHKNIFDRIPISRGFLPAAYQFSNWNNQLVAGSLPISRDSILLYSKNGALATDPQASFVARLEDGFPHRLNRINDAIKLPNGTIIAALPDGLFTLRKGVWKLLASTEDPIVSMAAQGDTLVAISRSSLYTSISPYNLLQRVPLLTEPQQNRKVSLFRIFWELHSGALFGLPGRLVVDLLGLALLILSISGIATAINRRVAKARSKQHRDVRAWRNRLRHAYKTHIWLRFLLIPFLLLAITGTFLRPPLLIAIAPIKVHAPLGTSLHSKNPWHDRLRKISYDHEANDFLLSTTDGFFSLPSIAVPTPLKINPTPPVSVMGCNVSRYTDSVWLVGSFSGLYRWHRHSGSITDALTGEPYIAHGGMPTFGELSVAGFSSDFACGPIVFDYASGARTLTPNATAPTMPAWLRGEPISLWNIALEIHTGRFFSALLGPITPLYIFLLGALCVALLITGWKRSRKPKRPKRTKPSESQL